MFILYAKLGVALAASSSLTVLFFYREQVMKLLDRHEGLWLIGWALTRLLPFIAVYLLLGFVPQSDVAEYYYPIGSSAARLEIPYRDVHDPYSPLFGFWMALPLLIWHNPKILVLFILLLELLTLHLTRRFYESRFSGSELNYRTLLYLFSPVPLVMAVLSGQEDVVIWLFALLAVNAIIRKQETVASIWLTIGALSTKAIFALVVPPFLIFSRRPVLMVLIPVLVGIPTVAFLYWKTGYLFMEQPMEEGQILKAPNWASVSYPFISSFCNPANPIWTRIGLLVSFSVSIYTTYRFRQLNLATSYPLIFVLTFAVMVVAQKNSVTNYAYMFVMAYIFTILKLDDRQAFAGFLLFNVLSAIHPSLWFRLGLPYYSTVSAIFEKPVFVLEYGIQLYLVAYFLYVAWQANQQLKQYGNVSRKTVSVAEEV